MYKDDMQTKECRFFKINNSVPKIMFTLHMMKYYYLMGVSPDYFFTKKIARL